MIFLVEDVKELRRQEMNKHQFGMVVFFTAMQLTLVSVILYSLTKSDWFLVSIILSAFVMMLSPIIQEAYYPEDY